MSSPRTVSRLGPVPDRLVRGEEWQGLLRVRHGHRQADVAFGVLAAALQARNGTIVRKPGALDVLCGRQPEGAFASFQRNTRAGHACLWHLVVAPRDGAAVLAANVGIDRPVAGLRR